MGVSYEVKIKKSALKALNRLPLDIQKRFAFLLQDLAMKGPMQPKWPNFSKLSDTEYHCHLKYSYVACWKHEKQTILIEVYYVGSREDAPY